MGVIMEFVSREHFDTYLRGLKYLGQGSQGACYLNTKNNTVYKVFKRDGISSGTSATMEEFKGS